MPKFVGAIDVNGAYTLPTADGSANQVLKTDGSGTVSFANEAGGGGSPGGSNTHIQFNNSDSFGGSANFTFDGTSTVTLASTDAGSSAAPIIELYRNSSSPADADYLGQIKFQGENDAGGKVVYAKITAKIDDASDTTEDGIIEIAHHKAGSNNISARFTSTALKLINGTGIEIADGLLTLGSTAVTATAAELNILDGVTATASELNILDGVTSTTAELNILDGVTSTASELNYLDGVTAGTVTASKALVVDSNKDISSLRNGTFTGTLTVNNSDDVDLDAVSGCLITGGDGTGHHLAFDNNEIMQKSSATTAGILYLQNDGGTVRFGNNTSLTEWSVSSGTNKFISSADILQLHNTSSATTGGYVGYYSSDATRLGYVGYPANDDLYVKQEDGDGDIYIDCPNARIYYFAGTYHFWKVGGTYELRLDGTDLRPYSNEGLNLGASGKAWNHFYLGQGNQFSSGGYWTLRSRDSDRQVMELVSSERFKKDIVDLPLSEAYQVLEARVIKYRGIDDDASVPLEVGLSAESLHNAGYEYAVRYDEGHWGETPRSIYYEYLTVPLIKICKDQKDKIEAMEARLAALEG